MYSKTIFWISVYCPFCEFQALLYRPKLLKGPIEVLCQRLSCKGKYAVAIASEEAKTKVLKLIRLQAEKIRIMKRLKQIERMLAK